MTRLNLTVLFFKCLTRSRLDNRNLNKTKSTKCLEWRQICSKLKRNLLKLTKTKLKSTHKKVST